MTHCIETDALKVIYIIDLIWSILNTLLTSGFTFHQVVNKNQRIFDFTGKLFRPRPIESMCFFGSFFNFVRMIDVILILADVGRNGIVRSCLFDLSWIFGIGAITCYFFGIYHTLAKSSKVVYEGWLGSQFVLDLTCVVMLLFPLVTIIPSVVSGFYADIGNIEMATRWTSATYFLWTFNDFLVGASVILAGLRLLKLLKHYLLTQGNRRENIAKIRLGARKVKIIILIGCSCLWGYAIFIGYYATSRYVIMQGFIPNIIITCLTLYTGPLATTSIMLALLLNDKILNGFGRISLGSSGNQNATENSELNTSHKYTHHFFESKSQDNQLDSFQLEDWNHLCQTNHQTPKLNHSLNNTFSNSDERNSTTSFS
ncbi:hypothetical protein BJ944DRAFT_39101 [Cunninghamella echinulata]|nr:hypothetical protein BJ944DRAFT_39101 [Cunninghamella echinulata]